MMNTVPQNDYYIESIRLSKSTKAMLDLQASEHSMNLQSYLETIVESVVEMREDEILAALSNLPEAQTALSGKELEEFERELKSW